ncbi:MAG: hypothetical protein ACREOW_09135 [Thermodesulfobacteriota bacterium]
MKKLIPGLIITFLIIFPPTLHAQTFSPGGFSKGGFRGGGFTRTGGVSKISGFKGGFGKSAATSTTSGMGPKNGNRKGFARSNFNRVGFSPNLSNKPNATFSNNTPYIKRQSINTGISNQKLRNINNPQGGLFKTVKNEPKIINPNLLTNTGNFRSNSLKNCIVAKENRYIAFKDDVNPTPKGGSITSFTSGRTRSRLMSRGLNSNTINNNRLSNMRNVNVTPNSLINRAPPKKEISSIQTDLSNTPSRNAEIAHWVDNGVMHFTNTVNAHSKGVKIFKATNGNHSAPVSKGLNVDRNLSTSGALTNSMSTNSKNPVRLSTRKNANSLHSDNSFVHNNNHVSNKNVFNFSFNFFFPSPFFFQPFFSPLFFDPFVFNPLIPSPFFTFNPLIPPPVINPFLFQPFFVSPFFNPFPISTVFFINTFVSNDVIID